MARYPLGQAIRLSFTVVDSTGTLFTPASSQVVLQKPDGTQVTYSTPTVDGTGLLHQDMTPSDVATIGHYQHVFSTSPAASEGVAVGEFDVFDPFEVLLLPLADAKAALNIPQSNTTDDAEIISMIAGIESALEKVTGGPIITRSISERVEATQYMSALVLRKRPLVSVTSIVDVASGVSLTLTDLDVDTNAGVLRRKLRLPWMSWGPYYTVTYTAGWGTAVPPAIQTAARIILQHLWETQRGSTGHPVMGGAETTQVFGMEYPIPTRAAFLLEPYTSEAFV